MASWVGMQVLALGTERSGTTSLSETLARLYRVNGLSTEVFHQVDEPALSKLACRFLSGEDVGKEVKEIISNWKQVAGVGTAIVHLLPYVAEFFGPNLKIIHLKRNRNDCVNSLVAHAHLRPNIFPDYVDADCNVENCPPTAVTAGEMSPSEWSALSIHERMAWRYDDIHRTIEKYKALFSDLITVQTEELSSEKTIRKISEYINPEWNVFVQASHLNRTNMINYLDLSRSQAMKFDNLFRQFDWNRAANDPIYACCFFPNRILDLIEQNPPKSEEEQKVVGAYMKAFVGLASRIVRVLQ